MANAYNNFGATNQYQGNYLEALKYHLDALAIREEIGDKFGIADSYNNIGGVYFLQGKYPEALKNHFIALKIREENGFKQRAPTRSLRRNHTQSVGACVHLPSSSNRTWQTPKSNEVSIFPAAALNTCSMA